VGTSGAYDGSSNSAWQAARGHYQALLDGVAGGGGDGPAGAGGDRPTGGDAAVAEAAAAIAAALSKHDPDLKLVRPRIYPLPNLLPSRRGRGGGGGGGGGVSGSNRGSGRSRDGSRRPVAKGIQRGALAVQAAHAYRARDAALLADLNLDLDELDQLGPRARCARILTAVLGDGNHPDDEAIRRASAEQVKAIILGDEPPSALASIQGLVAGIVLQLGLVELRAQQRAGVAPSAVVRIEETLRHWLESRVRSLRLGIADNVPPRMIRETAARVAQEAVRIVRAAAGAPTR